MATGLRAEFDPLNWRVWAMSGLLLAVSSVGKLGGTAGTAWLLGESLRDAVKLGGLTQCKGIMDVAVAMVLLDAGIISREFFGACLIFAAVSTAMTKPLVTMRRDALKACRLGENASGGIPS
jgi:Kef-type K+ transport system membrane component KefB